MQLAPTGMSGLSVVGIVVVVFVVIVVGMQLALLRRARAMEGKPLPALPGQVGQQIAAADHALVYFFSPQCGACRAITPRVRALAEHNDAVFAIDVFRETDLARALGVMATPSTVEIRGGKVVGYHLGQIPAPVMQRFA